MIAQTMKHSEVSVFSYQINILIIYLIKVVDLSKGFVLQQGLLCSFSNSFLTTQ